MTRPPLSVDLNAKPAGTRLAAFELPFPPSVNSYWRRGGNHTYISAAGQQYRKDVCAAVFSMFGVPSPMKGEVALVVDLEPPDARKRDIDNHCGKALFDALVHSGIIVDDSQIKKLTAEMHPKNPPGRVVVQVFEYISSPPLAPQR
jgi:crossover junction endodeoxyribonuclease RusA